MMKPLRATWEMRRALRQNDFPKALAAREAGALFSRAESFRAQHRLGLYGQVAERARREGVPASPRALLAAAVCCAAIGERAEAAGHLARLRPAARSRPDWRREVAAALAPHDAPLALTWLEADGPCPDRVYLALLVALLQAGGGEARAAALVSEALAAGLETRHPELLLHAGNLLLSGALPVTDAPADPQEKALGHLNGFLAWHGLEPLARRDPALPLSCVNVTLAQALVPLPVAEAAPLVSVIMTGYRTAARIGAALHSLLAQTYRNLQILVMDDASDDGLDAAVQAAARGDARVHYHRLPRNVGPYLAKDLALRHLARGAFVTCHDSDDWSHPRKIELQLTPLLGDPDLVFTWSQWLRLSDQGRIQVRQCHPLLRPNLSSLLFRREAVLTRAGGYDAVRTGADSELLSRLQIVFGRKAGRQLRRPLALGAARSDSLTNNAETGIPAGGTTPFRLEYWEAWRAWHLRCLTRGERPFMPEPGSPRPFPVSEAQRGEPGPDLLDALQPTKPGRRAAE